MRTDIAILMLAGVALLSGCRTTEPPAKATEKSETMLHLAAGLEPETLQFPDYLLMVDFEIDQHGRIPGSSVIGAELKTNLALQDARERFNAMLATNGWDVTRQDVSEHAFRLSAVKAISTLEIRSVQGTGSTQVFLLYQPGPGPLL